jgi:hypothetical protein
MTFRDFQPGSDVDAGFDTEALRQRCVPLIPALIGLLAATNVASVVFALMD